MYDTQAAQVHLPGGKVLTLPVVWLASGHGEGGRHGWRETLRQPAGIKRRSRVDSLSSLRDWTHRLGTFVSSAVVPLADKCQTVAEVDRLMNPEGADASPFRQYINALVVAKAAGNPRYQALVAEWRSKTPAGYMQDRLNAIVAALQTQGSTLYRRQRGTWHAMP